MVQKSTDVWPQDSSHYCMFYYHGKRLEKKRARCQENQDFNTWQMSKLVSQSRCLTHTQLMRRVSWPTHNSALWGSAAGKNQKGPSHSARRTCRWVPDCRTHTHTQRHTTYHTHAASNTHNDLHFMILLISLWTSWTVCLQRKICRFLHASCVY